MLGKRIVLCLLFVLTFTIVNSQTTLLMPTTGSKDTTISSCVLYDDGGLVGNHSAHTYATYTFRTGNPNTRYRITINPYLYHYNEGLASIKIYNGDQVISDSLLSDNNVNGGQMIGDIAWFTYSSSDVITVEFKADDNDPQPGFMIVLDECGCEKANNVVATFTDTTTATITWDASSTTTEWEVDYTTYFPYDLGKETPHPSFANNDTLHTLTTNTNSITINNLDAHSFYSFNVRPKCDTYPGKGTGELVSACPCVMPSNLTMSYDKDSIYFNWENPRSYDIVWTINHNVDGTSVYDYVDTTYWSMPNSDSLGTIYVLGNCSDESGKYSNALVCNEQWIDIDTLSKIKIIGDSIYCKGDSIVLAVEGVGNKEATYLWNTGDTTSSIYVNINNFDTIFITDTTANTDTIIKKDTTYTCQVTIKDGGCINYLSKQINIENSYSDTITSDICEGESYDEFNFHENTTGTYTQFLTTVNGCDSNTTLLLTVHPATIDTFDIIGCDEGYTDDNFSIQESGTYTRMLSSVYGCDSLVTINFLYIETIKDTIDAEIYMGDTFTNSMFHEGASGTYTYDSIDEYGCTNTYTLNLKVIELKFPNVITANNDGVNDLFEPKDLLTQTIFDETILRIYNRYGRLIFEKKNTHSKEDLWDPLDTNTPTGTYFYRFIAKSKKKNIDVTGTVEVLRE